MIMRFPLFDILSLQLLLLLLFSNGEAAIHNTAGSITFFDLTNIGLTGTGDAYSHKAQIVYSEENQDSLRLPSYHRLVINLMLPPEEYSDLCVYPLATTTSTSSSSEQQQQNSTITNITQQPSSVVLDDNATTIPPTTISPKLESLLENVELPLDFDFAPIAFLVPLQTRRGGINVTDCGLLTKIKVALQYKQEMIQDELLWSIIFYNTHEDEDDDEDDEEGGGGGGGEGNLRGHSFSNNNQNNRVYPMGIPNDLDSNDIPGLDSLILATVSHATGIKIKEEMERSVSVQYNDQIRRNFLVGDDDNNSTFAPYHLLNEGNLDWQFPVSLERGANIPFRGSNSQMDDSTNRSSWGDYTFIWFRFVLFFFILCFPFVRCFRMWWAAGGRIRFRRNDRGWITGLMYQPAMDNWYNVTNAAAGNDAGSRQSSKRNRLTKEQVLELPEIEYTGQPEGSIHGNENQISDMVDIDLESADATEDSTKGDSQQTESPSREETITSNQSDIGSIESSPVTESRRTECAHDKESDEPCFTTTLSTMCSICIDEFEHGENVRLLPRCGHAFHTECIVPWLTERQGYCPFCKTNVLKTQGNESNEEDGASGEENQQPNTTEEQEDLQTMDGRAQNER